MNNKIDNVFSQQITIVSLLKLFEDMAATITQEYMTEYKANVSEGAAPLFGDLLVTVKELHDRLKEMAMLIRKDYRDQKGHMSIKLTVGCKRIIKKSLNDYMAYLKSALYR